MNRFIFVALTIVACDRKVITTYEKPEVSEESIECTYTGLCYGCSMVRNEYKCGFGLRSDCEGHQQATVERTPYIWHWESKPRERMVGYDRRIVKRHGECK